MPEVAWACRNRGRLVRCFRPLTSCSAAWGGQQAGHVLDGDAVAAHVFQLQRQFDEACDAVHRTDGVAQRSLGVLAAAVHGSNRRFQVAFVVQGVEDTKHVDAVLRALFHEGFHDVVSIVPVAQEVLAAQQHLQARVGQGLAQPAQTLPGVFLEKPDAGVESRAAPDFQRPESGLVQFFADGQHVFGAQAGGDQRLVSVAQDHVGEMDCFFRCCVLLVHGFIALN